MGIEDIDSSMSSNSEFWLESSYVVEHSMFDI